MKLSELHSDSLKPKGASVAKSPAGNSLSKPIPCKPDILPIQYQVNQLMPVSNRTLQARDMAQSMSMADVSRVDAPPV